MEDWNPWATGTTWVIVAVVATLWIQSERLTVRRAEHRHSRGLPLTSMQEAIVNGNVDSGIRKNGPGGDLTKRDLVLGEQAARVTTALTVATFIIMAVIAVFVVVTVPEGTTYPTTLKYSNGVVLIPVWAAIFPPLLWPVILLIPHRGHPKEERGHMGSGSRKGLAMVLPVMLVWPLYAQLMIGLQCMERGGVLDF